ncbi:phage baseplate plug family protein [Leptospira kmetyi]|uniref:Cyanophage baseplate Pam3 plug gp18 domain-containing protein n=1 Tax=Leptospira kmetyi TaxID=408139 RepID=A0A2M9XVL0_9LEPT|nr:hypothetical protein [Leptospira kmetyi]AYV56953.1 hypothetical protein EFP84_16565 [Leptospira kmetyi]EQA54964.1 hypothetical protein LEP1GSC052_1979 [Leptospira kmetyi serovar Malaysia str. Bejo-Iso9]PJZ31680.1 hypothetical protein CH378_00235 [Leptospira kmetyi]PJZ43382.1 hypothetical protein CH370_02850 [Leptospira kmetyi]TGK21684.1 hypothetical protein EHO62_04535 [Leptospira kmetyi]
MPIFKYLPVDPNVFPIRNTYEIGSKDYEFEFAYNEVGDFITVLVRDQDGNDLFSSRLVYGVPFNHVVVDEFPISILLKPLDLEDLYREEYKDIPVNRGTLGSTVQIYMEDVL